MNKEDTIKAVKELVKGYFESKDYEFLPGKTSIPLIAPTYSHEEANEAIESILTTFVTMGKKVSAFEKEFADYIGVKNAVMVNSGSSANLLALSVLSNPAMKKLNPGDEIITPAITWATTVYPMHNVNAVPCFVDVELGTFNIDPEQVKKAINEKTKAIMLVHLLGRPCNMDEIMEIAGENDLIVVEDTCESHGAEYKGKKAGSFGGISTFSFFFSHHISTIEGGMVLTDNEDYGELAKSLRAFGWIRDLKNREELALKYSDIDRRFLFVNTGFNIRPTDIQGAFGIHQIKKLERFIQIRRENADYWNTELEKFSDYFVLPREEKLTRHVYFGYPLTIKPGAPFSRKDLVEFLESKKIETRPIMSGNILEQPVMRLFNSKVSGNLENSKIIMRNSFFFGNHQNIAEAERRYIRDCMFEFLERKV